METWTRQQTIDHYRSLADRHRQSADRLRRVLGETDQAYLMIDQYERLAVQCDSKADEASDQPASAVFPDLSESPG
jgi:hypothetical protein